MKLLIFVCFLLSGVSGLIFQVVWTRMLGLVFGTSNFAITTVLTSFMAGLALGAFFTGRLSDRKNYNYLRGYGILEILVGLYGLTTPMICSYLMQQYAVFYDQFSPNFYLFSLIRFFVLFLMLLPPTALMGATLPLLCKFLTSRQDHQVGLKIGTLYGINTLGAVFGTILAGFFLIPFLGVSATIYTATAISVFAGITAVVLSFRVSPDSFQSAVVADPVAVMNIENRVLLLEVSARDFRFMLFGFACSGAIALAYETGWSRVLILILGGAVYSFTTMLATFLLGLALGALVMARLLDRNIHYAKEWFCGLQWFIGMSAFATMHLFHFLPEWYVTWVYRFHEDFTLFHVMKCLLAASIMFLPTLGLGMMFPLMARIKVSQGEVGRAVGDVYSINTIGSILGAFGMGFVLMPFLGVSASLMLCVFGNLLLAGLGWMVLKRSPWSGFVGLMITLCFCLSFLPIWDPSIMTSGVFRYAPTILKEKEEARESAKYLRRRVDSSFVEYKPPELHFYEDGLTCTVSVHQRGNSLVLKVNGKPDASSHADLFTQMMEAHLPLLFTPTLEETMVIGLATGITTGSAACYPNQRVTCLEIEESMLSAAQLFSPYNRNVMRQLHEKPPASDAPVEFKIIDARNHLLGFEKQYSVIVSSPSHPWLSGGSNLFTKEFFQLCKKRLKPEGILCQWLQLYEISWETLQVLLNTLRSEFPHLTFFHSDSEVLLVLASQQEIPLDWKRISERMKIPAVRDDLARLGLTHPAHIMAHYVTSTTEASSLFQTPFYNTDDNAYIEFITPRQIFEKTETSQEILQKFRQFTPSPLRSWIASIPQEEQFPAVLEYLKIYIDTRHYSDLLSQETILYELFSGRERGEIAGWLGLAASLLGKQDPGLYFQKMRTEAPLFVRGRIWEQEWLFQSGLSSSDEVFTKIATLDEEDAKRVRVLLHFQQGQYSEAIQEGQALLTQESSWWVFQRIPFLNALGRSYLWGKEPQYEQGIELLTRSEKLFREKKGRTSLLKFDDVFYDIARAYLNLNRIDLATVALSRSFKVCQDKSVLYYRRALKSNDTEEKLNALREAVALDPSFYQASLELWTLLKKHSPAEAQVLATRMRKEFSWFKDKE